MKIEEIHCKSILTRTSGYLQAVSSHSLNPYVGCGFGRSSCGEGCYVKFNQWLLQGREWGAFVDVKVNAAEVYLRTVEKEKKWARKNGGSFSIFLSSSTDPWQPIERKYRVTRQLLKAMREAPPDRLILQTHSINLLDDLEGIHALSRICDLRVHISLEGDTDSLEGLPPPAFTLEERMDVLKKLADQKIPVVACLSPLYPMQAPDAFFSRLSQIGITAVVIDHFIEGDGSRGGSRTFKTKLPRAMAAADSDSVHLDYRDTISRIAEKYLPVGISASGFAGRYIGPGS